LISAALFITLPIFHSEILPPLYFPQEYSVLKQSRKYQIISPQKLLKPFLFDKKFGSLMNYLNKRYW